MVEWYTQQTFGFNNMVYENCKIYGPYVRKDGISIIICIRADGSRTTVSYPKYLTELRLGRYLDVNETVDHFDGDFLNNEVSNLRVMDFVDHIKDDCKRLVQMSFKCPTCNKEFSLVGKKLSWCLSNRKRGMAGPFCGRSCAAKYSRLVQIGEIEAVSPISLTPTYIKLKHDESPSGESLKVDPAKTVNA